VRRSRSVSLLALAIAALAAPFVFLAPACSSQAAPVEQGGACEVVTDCAGGLICAPAKGATVCPCTCTSNLSGVQQLPPSADAGNQAVAKGDAAVNGDGAIGSDDATAPSDDAPSSRPLEAGSD
jgi:hypothetical protein